MTIALAVKPADASKPQPRPPAIPQQHLQLGALLTAAGLLGFGLILYIAANWDTLGRFGRFWLVAAFIGAGALAALASPQLKAAGLLVAFAATGAMLALIGQTYQTGADPWTLFAIWAGLTVPWALAARNDVLWTAWAAVVLTALSLWHTAQPLPNTGMLGPLAAQAKTGVLLGLHLPLVVTWGLALGLCLALAPWHRLDGLLGGRRWAFRLALALTLALVAGETVSAAFRIPGARLADYLLGMALLTGVAAAMLRQKPADMTLLAATALAFDAALIAGIARLVVPPSLSNGIVELTLVGLIAAVVVAASVILLMRVAGGQLVLPWQTADAAGAGPTAKSERPWAVVLLSGIGALMAAVPFILALTLLLGGALERGPASYGIGLAALVGAVLVLRSTGSLFQEQLATVALVCGGSLLMWGLYRDLPDGLAGLLTCTLALATAIWVRRPWLGALMGAVAALALQLAAASWLFGLSRSPALNALLWTAIAVAGLAALLIQRDRPASIDVVADSATFEATTTGWLAAALAGLAFVSGETFLIGSRLGIGAAGGAGAFDTGLMLTAARLPSGLVAAGAAYWLVRQMPELRSPLAIVQLATTTALALVMPALGAAAAVLAFAFATRRRVLALASVVAALWIIGAFYYNLSIPLVHKAMILGTAGAVLGAVTLASGARVPTGLAAGARSSTAAAAPAIARGMIAVGLVAVGGLSAQAIATREALIRTGTPVFIELLPVDPRSLMQGDYMMLRFRLPEVPSDFRPELGRRPRAIGKRDADGVLRLTRLATADSLIAADEMMIELVRQRGQWIVVTDAWYFKEGTAAAWQVARYGEFRVLANGQALLVGLADKNRQLIKVP